MRIFLYLKSWRSFLSNDFTLESRCERGGLLKIICDVEAHAVHIGVLITLMDYTWTADLAHEVKSISYSSY